MCLPYYSHESTLHMSAGHSTRSCSPLKMVLGKIRDWYQAFCTTYKTHTMATCHRGTGCPLVRSLDILTDDPEHADGTDQCSTNHQGKHPACFTPSSQGENHATPPLCLHSHLPSKCAYHIILMKALYTCQLAIVQDHVHHSKWY